MSNNLRILGVGKYCGNQFEWTEAPLPEPVTDEETRRLLDEAEQTAEYEDDIEDRTFWARGTW